MKKPKIENIYLKVAKKTSGKNDLCFQHLPQAALGAMTKQKN